MQLIPKLIGVVAQHGNAGRGVKANEPERSLQQSFYFSVKRMKLFNVRKLGEFQFKNSKLNVFLTKYYSGQNCVFLEDEDGEPFGNITIDIDNEHQSEEDVFIKTSLPGITKTFLKSKIVSLRGISKRQDVAFYTFRINRDLCLQRFKNLISS